MISIEVLADATLAHKVPAEVEIFSKEDDFFIIVSYDGVFGLFILFSGKTLHFAQKVLIN